MQGCPPAQRFSCGQMAAATSWRARTRCLSQRTPWESTLSLRSVRGFRCVTASCLAVAANWDAQPVGSVLLQQRTRVWAVHLVREALQSQLGSDHRCCMCRPPAALSRPLASAELTMQQPHFEPLSQNGTSWEERQACGG